MRRRLARPANAPSACARTRMRTTRRSGSKKSSSRCLVASSRSCSLSARRSVGDRLTQSRRWGPSPRIRRSISRSLASALILTRTASTSCCSRMTRRRYRTARARASGWKSIAHTRSRRWRRSTTPSWADDRCVRSAIACSRTTAVASRAPAATATPKTYRCHRQPTAPSGVHASNVPQVA